MEIKKVLTSERTKSAKIMMELAAANYMKNRDEVLERIDKEELKKR